MSYQSEELVCAVPKPSKRVLRIATRVAGKPGAVKRSFHSGQSAKSSRRHSDDGRKSLSADPQTNENGWK